MDDVARKRKGMNKKQFETFHEFLAGRHIGRTELRSIYKQLYRVTEPYQYDADCAWDYGRFNRKSFFTLLDVVYTRRFGKEFYEFLWSVYQSMLSARPFTKLDFARQEYTYFCSSELFKSVLGSFDDAKRRLNDGYPISPHAFSQLQTMGCIRGKFLHALLLKPSNSLQYRFGVAAMQKASYEEGWISLVVESMKVIEGDADNAVPFQFSDFSMSDTIRQLRELGGNPLTVDSREMLINHLSSYNYYQNHASQYPELFAIKLPKRFVTRLFEHHSIQMRNWSHSIHSFGADRPIGALFQQLLQGRDGEHCAHLVVEIRELFKELLAHDHRVKNGWPPSVLYAEFCTSVTNFLMKYDDPAELGFVPVETLFGPTKKKFLDVAAV